MKDYKTNNYRGYRTSVELVLIAIVLAHIVVSLSTEEISRFFGF